MSLLSFDPTDYLELILSTSYCCSNKKKAEMQRSRSKRVKQKLFEVQLSYILQKNWNKTVTLPSVI